MVVIRVILIALFIALSLIECQKQAPLNNGLKITQTQLNKFNVKPTGLSRVNSNIQVENLSIYTFRLMNYITKESPHQMSYPFINQKHKVVFVISQSEKESSELKITFQNDQTFIFGKKFRLLTPYIKASGYLDKFNTQTLQSTDPNFIREIYIQFNHHEYYDFISSEGSWYIHNIFDVTDLNNITYLIAYGIYNLEESFSDFDRDGTLDFKQTYFYIPNTMGNKHNKYRIVSLR